MLLKKLIYFLDRNIHLWYSIKIVTYYFTFFLSFLNFESKQLLIKLPFVLVILLRLFLYLFLIYLISYWAHRNPMSVNEEKRLNNWKKMPTFLFLFLFEWENMFFRNNNKIRRDYSAPTIIPEIMSNLERVNKQLLSEFNYSWQKYLIFFSFYLFIKQ
jgi:amino acid permease